MYCCVYEGGGPLLVVVAACSIVHWVSGRAVTAVSSINSSAVGCDTIHSPRTRRKEHDKQLPDLKARALGDVKQIAVARWMRSEHGETMIAGAQNESSMAPYDIKACSCNFFVPSSEPAAEQPASHPRTIHTMCMAHCQLRTLMPRHNSVSVHTSVAKRRLLKRGWDGSELQKLYIFMEAFVVR